MFAALRRQAARWRVEELATTRVQTKGKCALCGARYTKGPMTNHLRTCRRSHLGPVTSKGNPVNGAVRTARLFHIVVDGAGLPHYWMHLEVPTDAELENLDRFLRRTWLECCGHLSAFTIGAATYSVAPSDGFGLVDADEEDMDVALGEVLTTGTRFRHEYDFGTTTYLDLRVVSERDGLARGRSVQLLARNDAPDISCVRCGKPAASVCSQCAWESEMWLCKRCAATHECGEEMLLPVVNSPRVGMCGYTGEL